MNRNWILAGLSLALITIAAMPARAQEGVGQLADDLAGINRSLERMAGMLEILIGNQQVEILLKRIEMKERRLAPLESELRRAERALVDLEARVKRLNDEREELEDVLAEEMREGIDLEGSETRRMQEQLARVAEMEAGRVEEYRRRVLRLEDQLADGRDEILILDEQLMELLQ
jgi:predicted RNase H-like nuclease (RuvC/YqgF family)